MNSIKRLREKRGVTQSATADALQISRTTVAMWESGEALPRAGTLVRLAEYLCCSVDDLLKPIE